MVTMNYASEMQFVWAGVNSVIRVQTSRNPQCVGDFLTIPQREQVRKSTCLWIFPADFNSPPLYQDFEGSWPWLCMPHQRDLCSSGEQEAGSGFTCASLAALGAEGTWNECRVQRFCTMEHNCGVGA